jgi:hypothetical protein
MLSAPVATERSRAALVFCVARIIPYLLSTSYQMMQRFEYEFLDTGQICD